MRAVECLLTHHALYQVTSRQPHENTVTCLEQIDCSPRKLLRCVHALGHQGLPHGKHEFLDSEAGTDSL